LRGLTSAGSSGELLVGVLGVQLLGVLVVELELVLLTLFGTGGDMGDKFAVDYGRLRRRCQILTPFTQ